MSAQDESLQALQQLGFSELEAAVYTFLLQQAPATGYKIANAIGKPIANTYKAINALQDKGAILVEEGENRLCRAVAPRELVAQMQQTLRQQCEQAVEALAIFHASPEDERVYRLHTREQVIERARQMLGRCRQVALVSAFPHILEEIRADLELTAGRGVGVLLKAYRPIEVQQANITFSNEADLLLSQYPGEELNLVTDAEEHLIALLEKEGRGVIQAIWSASAFLSVVQYNGLYDEWELTRQNRQIAQGVPLETLQKTIMHRVFPLMETPGYLKLIQRTVQRQADATD